MEEYEGPRFIFTKADGEIPEVELRRYLLLDAMLRDFLDPDKNEGNMSMRTMDGFLIKRAGARMTALEDKDVSLVLEVKGDEVTARGAEPSSEARMHHRIYATCPEAEIVLHFHDEGMLGRFEGPAMGPYPYGTVELAQAAGELARSQKLFMIKEHGFIIIAKDEQELIQRLREWRG